MNKFKTCLLLATALTLSGCNSMPSVDMPSLPSLPSWMGGHTKPKEKLVGERISVIPIDAALQPDPALKDTKVSLPAVTVNADWTAHSGMFAAEAGNLAGSAFDKQASASVGEGNEFVNTLVITPVVAGGKVFAMDALGFIVARDVTDISKTVWSGKGASEEDELPVYGGGLAYDDGKLYVTSGRGKLMALDGATGKELWTKQLHVPFRSAPRIAGGKLFATTIDNQLFAVNLADGDVLWTQRGISETTGLMNTVSPAASGDVVVVPYSSGEVYVLADADGREVWSESLSGGKHAPAATLFGGIGGDPVIDGSVVFTANSAGLLSVRALTTGQPAWEMPVGTTNTPWIAGEYLFVLTAENTLVCMHKFDGHIRWSTKLTSFEDETKKKNPITWKGPVLVDGKLALVGSNAQLLLVDAADGKIAATKEIPEDIYTPPVVAGGKMYLVSKDATLYQLY